MEISTKQKYKLKKFIKEISLIKGRHTELVSVYVPAGYDIQKIIAHLQQEQGTASNIKDKTTQQHVIDSLEKMIRHLKMFRHTPENGLAVFSGNVAEREGKTDIRVWSIEPPIPLNVRIYRCDQTFNIDILKEMLEEEDTYGLIIIERKEATIGLLKGTRIQEITTLTSGIPGKFKAGGSSAARLARVIEGMAKEFYNRVAEVINKEFLPMKEMKGILVGGPGQTKQEFIDGNWFNEQLRRKIISIQDLSYGGMFGLRELVDKSKDVLVKQAISEEKIIMEKFFKMLSTEPSKVAYGNNEVKKALEFGAVEKLLLSESLEDKEIEEFEALAEKSKADIQIISLDTMEGEQLRELGKVAAILRFSLY